LDKAGLIIKANDSWNLWTLAFTGLVYGKRILKRFEMATRLAVARKKQ
jgi:hypothetical protein